jgi:hypothetical protein
VQLIEREAAVDEIRLDTLRDRSWAEVHAAMQGALSDCAADMSYLTEALLRHRALRNGVDLAGSVGALSEGRLAGFTLVGYGAWRGESAAFDAGTGILKAFRRQRLARKMFDSLERGLRARSTSGTPGWRLLGRGSGLSRPACLIWHGWARRRQANWPGRTA